ncbi:binding-protein-dependent transport system inner membrane protein [Roseivivax marinus]|uniref:Binding-protein-dependent transport system inner membrane protein n=1 Tax=Roseivivax marinus TaxID=1379903 RepID=W4HJT4_9RHOB|nr:ABC transporter permease [Roseivivax marinus]ETW12371.1 binding-protein-dependent transport system inner membrane protein [Roseivivax marinus]
MTDATQHPMDGPTPDDALRQAKAADSVDDQGRLLAADGTPLKRSLARSLRVQKIRALALIAPLLLFVLVTFIAPIADMLFRSVENEIVPETLPRTVQLIGDWDHNSGEAPDAELFEAFYYDMAIAAQLKNHTRLGTRLNYEQTGISSLFRQSGRDIEDIGDIYVDQFEDLDEAWEEPATWLALMGDADWRDSYMEWFEGEQAGAPPAFQPSAAASEALPRTVEMYTLFSEFTAGARRDSLAEDEPWPVAYTALYQDLTAQPSATAPFEGEMATLVGVAEDAVADFETVDFRSYFIDEIDEDWGNPEVWATIQTFSGPFTAGYFLNAVDMQETPDGVAMQPDDQRIYGLLFKRTMFMSLTITFCCIALGYPVAYLLATLPMRSANLLMILVLLPFWTSLLVRTSAWKVMLQQQGVINDVLVWLGLVGDGSRLVMINNQFGTIVAMTHILLPFMILPMYSVMSTIPPSYVRAAKSLGATNWTAFWRVYFPQSVPGIGAGSILVFILAIGYYITPEIVGGTTGTFISNRIAYHISSSLNWGLAAALGTILLGVVLILYWAYDRIVGIDNVKLGG